MTIYYTYKTYPSEEKTCEIKNVWKHNLEEEFNIIRNVVQSFTYVAMDTEFPGVTSSPLGTFSNKNDRYYAYIMCNVNSMKLIQLGLSFFDAEGNQPTGTKTWQFNFHFDLNVDMYAENSILLLKNSGINFDRHLNEGIDTEEFACLLITSGVVITEEVTFISFHSSSDFGYLLKILTNQKLPDDVEEFFGILHLYFPIIYDVKHLLISCKNLTGGLQLVAELLGIERVGQQHQAGSDAQLTGYIFFKIKELYFGGSIDASNLNQVYGFDLPIESGPVGEKKSEPQHVVRTVERVETQDKRDKDAYHQQTEEQRKKVDEPQQSGEKLQQAEEQQRSEKQQTQELSKSLIW